MEPDNPLWLLLAAVVFGIVYLIKQSRLEDPENTQMIYARQMRDVCCLKNGPVFASLFRQSGNMYRDLGRFDEVSAAFSEIEKSFIRARIECVAILQNTSSRFEVVGLHRSHGGKAEGKKLGGAIIASETR